MSYKPPQIIAVPKEAHPQVKKLYTDIIELSKERTALVEAYLRERSAVEAKYAPMSEELIHRINAAKIKGSENICKACGITYSPDNGYSVDAQYLDFGVAFVIIEPREDGARFDGQQETIPVGTLLN